MRPTILLALSHRGDSHALEWFINQMRAIKFLRAKGGIRQTHLTPKSLSRYLVLIILRVKRDGKDEILRTVNILQNVRHFRGLNGSLHGCQARVEVLTTTDQRWEGNAP